MGTFTILLAIKLRLDVSHLFARKFEFNISHYFDETSMRGKVIKSTDHFILQYFPYFKERQTLTEKIRDIQFTY